MTRTRTIIAATLIATLTQAVKLQSKESEPIYDIELLDNDDFDFYSLDP